MTTATLPQDGTTTLPGGITAHTEGRTVWLTGNTYPIKDRLGRQGAGFRWDSGRRRWEGTTANLQRLTASLAATPAYGAPAAPKFPPTPEQQAILRAVATGQDAVVSAGAGAGKTSTLELIAAAHAAKQILLIVFNKSMQIEAQERMPRNVESRTFDSLGFAGAPREMVEKFQAQRDAGFKGPRAAIRKLIDVAAHLGLDMDPIEIEVEITEKIDGKTMTRKAIETVPPARTASLALRTVEQWCTTADPEIDTIHVMRGNEGVGLLAEHIVPVARRVWEDICSPTGRLRITNGHLTKMWALGEPDFTKAGTGPRRIPDMILVDEAQDTAPVVERIVFAQAIQTVLVGDSAQAIYGWRGAQDCLAHADVPADYRLPLTQSWRFGPEIAEAGNAFLRMLHNPFEIEGAGKPGRVLPAGSMYGPDAVLCRTNAGMLSEIQDLLEHHAKVAVPKGTKTDLDLLARTIRWLMGGPIPTRIHDDLAAFGTWEEVTKAVESGDADRKVEKVHDLVTSLGIDQLEQLVESLREIGEPGVSAANGYTIVTTGHKAKGLQWKRVKIGWDFPAPRKTLDGGWWEPGAEELKLAYVAVTRAQTELDPGSLAWALED